MYNKRVFALLLLGIFIISFGSAEYYIDIYADDVTGASGSVTVTDLGNDVFRVNATDGNYEVDRALVMDWLFGKIPHATPTYITNPTNVFTIEPRDNNKRGYSLGRPYTGGAPSQPTITSTFLDTTTNLDSSIWSDLQPGSDGVDIKTVQFPTGTTVNTATGPSSSNEIGTDRSADEQDNPSGARIFGSGDSPNAPHSYHIIILASGNMTWDSIGDANAIDFLSNHSFPIIEFRNLTTILNSPEDDFFELPDEDIIFNFSSSINSQRELKNGSLYINGTLTETKLLSGIEDTETFTESFSTLGDYNWSVQVCDNESICTFSETRDFTISTVKELSLTYNEEVLDLSLEDFVLQIESTEVISSAKMNYDGVDYESSILSLGSGVYRISNSIQIPDVAVDTNETFFFEITTPTTTFITDSNIQLVFILLIDNCGAYTNELFNISLFDEKTLLDLDGTIEVNLELFNNDKQTALTNAVNDFYNMSNMQICSNINLTASGYFYDLEMRYYVDPTNTSTFLYVPEFYHIQKAGTSNFPQTLNLYNLNINQSTEFTMFYRDNDYVARENVLLQIQRKYINEGIFRTVEIPITSSEGSAIGHFDLNNYKYKIIATQNGEILNVFDNPAIVCESELSGICTLTLNGQGSPNPFENFETIRDLSYDISLNGTEVTVDYVIPSGETKTINVYMFQVSSFADDMILCNKTLTSSAGSFTCNVSSTIGDSNVFIEIRVDGVLETRSKIYFQEDLSDYFNLNNYAIGSLFLILLITMMVSSPMIMVASAIFSVALLGFLFLLKGSSIGLVLGSFSWLVVAGILILIKLNKKDET